MSAPALGGPPIFATPADGFALRSGGATVLFTERGLTIGDVRWSLAGATPVSPRAVGRRSATVSTFRGASAFVSETWSGVVYDQVRPKVSLELEPRPRGLEYTLRLEPGATPVVPIRVEGVSSISVSDDAVELGPLRESGLRCWQLRGDEQIDVAARYGAARQVGESTWEYELELSGLDPALPTVVDPVLEWSTLTGAAQDDFVQDSAIDVNGNTYLIGATVSPMYPAQGGPQPNLNGSYDAFVTKLDPDGGLLWSTFLGGSAQEVGVALAVDATGAVVVSFAIERKDRGALKQAMVHVGFPVEDLCGYAEGAPLPISLRRVGRGGAAFGLRDYQREAVEAFHQGGGPRGGAGVRAPSPCASGSPSCSTRRSSPPSRSASTPERPSSCGR